MSDRFKHALIDTDVLKLIFALERDKSFYPDSGLSAKNVKLINLRRSEIRLKYLVIISV